MGAIVEGHYFRKQFGCKSGIIAWSHRSRFLMGVKLIGPSVPRLLDYGCGDGTFLVLAADRFQEGFGADLAVDQIEDCRKRLASLTHLKFGALSELSQVGSGFDIVMCMETLEHCTAPVVEKILDDFARLALPTGRIIISVPIEIGPTFFLKWAVRKVAGWRKLSDYRHYERYSFGDAFKMIFANRNTVVKRPIYGPPESPSHSHYGFNWRALREVIRGRFEIEQTRFSPLGFLGGWVSSQVWFVCRPPAEGEKATAPK